MENLSQSGRANQLQAMVRLDHRLILRDLSAGHQRGCVSGALAIDRREAFSDYQSRIPTALQ